MPWEGAAGSVRDSLPLLVQIAEPLAGVEAPCARGVTCEYRDHSGWGAPTPEQETQIAILLPGCSLETEDLGTSFYPRGLELLESCWYKSGSKAGLHHLLAKVEILSLEGK